MIRARRKLGTSIATAALLGAIVGVPVLSAPAGAAPATVTIGVDHATPANHNFEYVDFFPRSGATIHSGDIVHFQWSSTPDGLHTATLLRAGETPATAWNTVYPITTPDPDDSASQQQFNPQIGGPTFPPPGSGAPGACGDAATPCPYDGTADLNSGAKTTDGTGAFYAQVTAPAGTTVSYVCLVHPGMVASLSVAAPATPASTQAQLDAAASAQASADDTEALAAEAAAGPATSVANSNGTKTWTVTAGTGSQHVEVVEFLPRDLQIGHGDSVKYATTTIHDIHTITFPQGTDSAEPLPQFCEGTPDTPFVSGAGPPCGNPANFETHFDAAPVGPTSVASTTTVASSGLIASPPVPLPTNYTFSFPNAGTFNYFCHIHANGMLGAVTVLGAVVTPPATPVSATPKFTG